MIVFNMRMATITSNRKGEAMNSIRNRAVNLTAAATPEAPRVQVDGVMSVAGIKNAIRLRRGRCGADVGTFFAWPIDGYYDLHFVADCDGRDEPDGSDCIEEFIGTLREARRAADAENAFATMLT